MQWKHASSPPPKKFRAMKSAGKVLLTVFFDVQGPLLVEFLEYRKSINSDVYCETLQRLRRSIKNKRLGLFTEGVVLLHDNARSHVSRVTQMELDKFKWETLDHPAYSPDMLPCDFHVFGPPEREVLQLGRRTLEHCEGLGLVTATGILGTRNPAACSSDGRLNSPRCIWNVPIDATGSHSNITISFPGAEWAVLCNGRKNLHILYTPSRSAGEPWMCCHTYDMEISTSSYLLHSVHRTIPGSQQIDCIVATVEHKSKLPDDVSFPDCYTFVSVLEWISFTCGQNNQIWTTKRTRKLVSSTFPEYAAIDSIGDAVCVVSQNNFKCYFDSEGMVNSNIDTIEKGPLRGRVCGGRVACVVGDGSKERSAESGPRGRGTWLRMARRRGLLHIEKSSMASALDRARQHVMGVSPVSSFEESSGGYTGHVRKVWEFVA
ncbi:nudC domain-containing protein 1 [Trichonephila clavipes]|nr:nudC domain-containing protein 1 [Trichonephila clavipes]